jgi:hypothetical protein
MIDHNWHDFGSVIQGSKQEHRFVIVNSNEEEVHIQSVTSKFPACFSTHIDKQLLKQWEKAEIVVTMDTSQFVGKRSATIDVVFDKPDQGVVPLLVTGNIKSKSPLSGKDNPVDKNGVVDPLQSSRAAEMRSILLAGIGYAVEHPGWPASLDELSPKYLDASKAELSQFVYRPLSEESLRKNPQEVPVLFEKMPAFDGGQLVGWADGYVEFIRDSNRLKQLFPEQMPVVPGPGLK